MFKRATREESKLRAALFGPPGSGKTYTMLTLCSALVEPGAGLAVIDTEWGSASKYADRFEFDVVELADFHPNNYVEAIKDAKEQGYGVLGIDSISHAWNGARGILELVDQFTQASASGNTFTSGWSKARPIETAFWNAILGSGLHVVATFRSKTEYVMEQRNGQSVPRKVGLGPIQRDGVEYEFDVVGELDLDHRLRVSKSRYESIPDGTEVEKPGLEFATKLAKAMQEGEAPVLPEAATDEQYDAMLKLLLAEGRDERRVEEVADGIRAHNHGVLPAEWVAKETEKAAERVARSQPVTADAEA